MIKKYLVWLTMSRRSKNFYQNSFKNYIAGNGMMSSITRLEKAPHGNAGA